MALVTGANRGMGLETSRQLLARGMRVVMCGRDVEATDKARRTLGDLSKNAIAVCRQFVPAMAERGYGRVVNVSSGIGQLANMSTFAPAYAISKTALNAFTRILAQTYRRHGVLANAVDPGWVRTDMGGASAPRSVTQGVDTTVWLATLPDDGPTGGFFHDRHPIPW